MMKDLLTIPLLVACCLLFSCAELKEEQVLKLAHGHDVSHPVHQAMVYMGEQLKEISGGQMSVKIYTGGQLGAERECIELLQIGSLAITKVSSAVMENFAPSFKALGLPYIFTSKAHRFAVLDGPVGRELLLEGEKFWLRGLCFYDAGSRSFYTKEKPVMTPDDLKGLKIRVMPSNTAMSMVKALGGSPTPISWGELYTALQQGVVDGAENNSPSFFSSRHYEVCKYYSIDEHTAVPDVLLISTHIWNKLSAQEQTWLQEAVDRSVVKQHELWAAAEKETMKIVQAAGVEVFYPDKKLFQEKVKPVLEEYMKIPEIGDVVRKIQAVEPPTQSPE